MGKTLAAELTKPGDAEGKTFGHDPDGTLRQRADVDYLPSGPHASKVEGEKLFSQVGLRLLIVHLVGSMSLFQRKLRLWLRAPDEAISKRPSDPSASNASRPPQSEAATRND